MAQTVKTVKSCAFLFTLATALASASGIDSDLSCIDARCIAGDGVTASSLAQKMRVQSANSHMVSENGNINPSSGAWEKGDGASHGAHVFSRCLSKGLNTFASSRGVTSALDLGAGAGHYSAAMLGNGINTSCYDGNPDTKGITAYLCEQLDLSVRILPASLLQRKEDPAASPKPAEFVWSLEVGEHIPSDREAAFMDNLAALATKYLVLSWAITGQTGNGHVNERDNDYVIQEMEKRGLVHDLPASMQLRQAAGGPGCCCSWFNNTLMAFNKTTRQTSWWNYMGPKIRGASIPA